MDLREGEKRREELLTRDSIGRGYANFNLGTIYRIFKKSRRVEKIVIKRRPRRDSNPFNLLSNETDGAALLLKEREG